MIFLTSKLKIKWIKDRKEITKKIYPVGVCFVKNDIPNTIGRTNHHNLELVCSAKIKQKTAITDV